MNDVTEKKSVMQYRCLRKSIVREPYVKNNAWKSISMTYHQVDVRSLMFWMRKNEEAPDWKEALFQQEEQKYGYQERLKRREAEDNSMTQVEGRHRPKPVRFSRTIDMW